MANSVQEKGRIHHDAKQWQHCSLFNLDLFNDDRHHLQLSKPAGENIEVGACHGCCSASSNDVDDATGKQRLNHSCSFAVLQKNYTTQLEHVAERLLSNENNYSTDCPCCPSDTNDTRVQSINRKILLGSTAILDNFLRNNLRTALATNVNSPTSCFPSLSSTTTDASRVDVTSTIMAGTGNQRRWHSERGSRHPNVRANLPLTSAQRQVLERYMNYPLIKAPVHRTNIRRSYHHHRPLIGKAGENTGTALAALAEQPLAPLAMILPATSGNLRKESVPLIHAHARPLSSTSSSTSAASRHSTLSRRCFLADTIPQSGKPDDYSDDDDDDDDHNDSISSEQDHTSDEESDVLIEPSSLLATSAQNVSLSETLFECTICGELRRLLKRPCCDFSACTSCLTTYVEQQVRQGIIRMQCPNHQCHIYMHRDEIHKRCTCPELRQKFTRFLLETNRSINVKTCPRCSFIHEIGTRTSHSHSRCNTNLRLDLELCRSMHRTPTKVQCVECSLIWCFQCHSPWHDGIQCKEFRRGDRMLKKWAREVHYGQQNAQQCPSCKVDRRRPPLLALEHTFGCFDHRFTFREPRGVITSFVFVAKRNSATNAVIVFATLNSLVSDGRQR